MPSKSKKETTIYFENKGVEYINIVRIFCDSGIVKSLSTSCVKCSMPTVTYKLTPRVSDKFFNFNNNK